MRINPNLHLTYCTNIHSGESWEAIFENLKTYIPCLQIANFGIGLRLSDRASKEILEGNKLAIFKEWLKTNNYYVFTMNGFPFGNFHKEKVKDAVHLPDWTTQARLDYTLRLFDILAEILPQNEPFTTLEGGISTSPLSYKLWWQTEEEKQQVFETATENLIKVVEHLVEIREKTGKLLHLDIEPEPDGMLENTKDTLAYFIDWLFGKGAAMLSKNLTISTEEAKKVISTHIQICYDICHFAVEYENHAEALQVFENHGIKIGKFQISAALKADLPKDEAQRKAIFEEFTTFNESVYLHQVIAKNNKGKLFNFNDLPKALIEGTSEEFVEWRTHFHVPIFLSKYRLLQSTQEDITEVLTLLKQKTSLTQHLEIETYTWDVLPKEMQVSMEESISRELKWVREQLI
ncbi:MAG: xylose isomerase [Cytophagales bacterium]|nr:MAG: xylose isomerase [Cytophagales bacterium]